MKINTDNLPPVRAGDGNNSLKYWEKEWANKGRRAETWSTKRTVNVVKELKPKTVLEVGCGAGGLLKPLKDLGANVFGIDLSQTAIDRMKKRYDINGAVLNVYDLDKLDATFDFITAHHLFEHLIEDEKALRLCKSKLNTGGTILASVPNNCASPEESDDHVRMYDEESFKSLFIKVFGNCETSNIGNHLFARSKMGTQ